MHVNMVEITTQNMTNLIQEEYPTSVSHTSLTTLHLQTSETTKVIPTSEQSLSSFYLWSLFMSVFHEFGRMWYFHCCNCLL